MRSTHEFDWKQKKMIGKRMKTGCDSIQPAGRWIFIQIDRDESAWFLGRKTMRRDAFGGHQWKLKLLFRRRNSESLLRRKIVKLEITIYDYLLTESHYVEWYAGRLRYAVICCHDSG